ncbi:MAG TPA: endonuclease III [Syntrophorhabdaceae bacterium]|jgi:endonuclease-3
MQKDIGSIIDNLEKMHGGARVELHFKTPLELMVATVLSAQCTDERVNRVTLSLFKKYGDLNAYLEAPLEELEEDIRPTGFYRNKAKALKNIASEILGRFGGHIPEDVDTLATIKGIGRKTANLIVGAAFGKPAMVVETHVIRVANRVGLTSNKDPEKIEIDLKKLVAETEWTRFSLLLTLHGRYVCKARKPECNRCLIRDYCNYWLGGMADV